MPVEERGRRRGAMFVEGKATVMAEAYKPGIWSETSAASHAKVKEPCGIARHATGCYQGVNRPDEQRTQAMERKQGPC